MSAHKPVKRKHTAREIAEKCGLSTRTVRRYIAQSRADYEAQSLTKSKPWEAFGLSRATWYRKGKPQAFEVSEA